MKYVKRAIMFIAILSRNDCPTVAGPPRCDDNYPCKIWLGNQRC